MPRRYRISLVGSGAVGSALAIALAKKGFPIVSIVSRTGRTAKALGAKVGCRRISTSLEDLARDTQILLLAVPDDAIRGVAAEIAKIKSMRPRGLAVVHCSGVHSSEALLTLKKKGAVTASMHPVQSFPQGKSGAQQVARLRGIYYGIEGDEEGLKTADLLVKELGGNSIVIPKEMKPLYHAACVFASNYFTVLLNAIGELTIAAKLYHSWTEVFGPLMTSTMENAIELGPGKALTGPVVRKDGATVDLHLAALAANAPQLLSLYTICGIEAGRLARRDGRLSDEEYRTLVARFSQFIKSLPTKKQ